jgi:flavin reductase (DIM6/NTAB) family NADH-FMN oxidoreductase RutF
VSAADPPVDPLAFRRVMGAFATGVTVVAAQQGDEVHGMTANAFTSVSLDPLLVLVCIATHARMDGFIRRAGGFSVNFLSADQEPLSRYFANAWRPAAPPEFRFDPWDGGPRLVGSLASVGCRLDHAVDAGDHRVVLGRVIALFEGDPTALPLLFFSGRYRRLSELEGTVAPEPWSHQDVQIFYESWPAPDQAPADESS